MVDLKKPSLYTPKEHLEEAASQIFEEGSKKVKEYCNEGLNRASELEQSIEEYVGDLALKIRKKPITSVLIAVGIGYIWAKLTK